jgi:hypothetical protein
MRPFGNGIGNWIWEGCEALIVCTKEGAALVNSYIPQADYKLFVRYVLSHPVEAPGGFRCVNFEFPLPVTSDRGFSDQLSDHVVKHRVPSLAVVCGKTSKRNLSERVLYADPRAAVEWNRLPWAATPPASSLV